MSLKRYLDEIGSVASEIGLYTPLATHVFGALLGYPAKHEFSKAALCPKPFPVSVCSISSKEASNR
jgi:hypothetical protein